MVDEVVDLLLSSLIVVGCRPLLLRRLALVIAIGDVAVPLVVGTGLLRDRCAAFNGSIGAAAAAAAAEVVVPVAVPFVVAIVSSQYCRAIRESPLLFWVSFLLCCCYCYCCS